MLMRSPRIACISRGGEQILSVEEDLSRDDLSGLSDKLHDAHRGHALAAAGLSDDADDLSLRNGEGHVVDSGKVAMSCVKHRPEVLNFQRICLTHTLLLTACSDRDP